MISKKLKDRFASKYEAKGATAVYEYANKIGIKEWKHCLECDAKTPHIDNECLVCGRS